MDLLPIVSSSAPASPSAEDYAPSSAKETASDDAMDVESVHGDDGCGRQAIIDLYFNTAAAFINNRSSGEKGKISRNAPNQICMVQSENHEDGAPETSATGANRPDVRTYPMNATMPDGSTIVIMKDVAPRSK